MQIGHANPELLGPAGLARTNAASSAGTVRASTPTSSDPPPMGSNQTLDMDAFMSAWGSNDQTWDVDGSGMVDGTDLGTLLSVQSAADAGDAGTGAGAAALALGLQTAAHRQGLGPGPAAPGPGPRAQSLKGAGVQGAW